ncbi:MAG: hypothetical protein ABR907_01970, partial [Terracidiphilus sp.]
PMSLGLSKSLYLDAILNSSDETTDDEVDDDFDDEDFDTVPTAEERNEAQENLSLHLTDDEREDIWASFSNCRHLFQFWNLVVGLIFSFGSYLALFAINKKLAGTATSSEIQLFPSPWLWCFFPAFGGFCLAWHVRVILWSIFGNSRMARLYRIWARRKSGGETNVYAVATFNRWFIRLIVLPLGFFMILALNMHATLGPEAIRECGYAFKPCTVFKYSDFSRITKVARHVTANNTTGAMLVLDFKDGRRWSTGDWGDEIDDVDPAVVRFLEQKTSLPIVSANRIEEIPAVKIAQPAAGK